MASPAVRCRCHQTPSPGGDAMDAFIQQHLSSIIGWISGWDRLRFRGTLRLLANVVGMRRFLSFTNCLLKDFGAFALESSRLVRSASLEVAEASGRPGGP